MTRPDHPGRLRQWCSIVTILLTAAIFLEAVFAGAMLSGVEWARAAHSMHAVSVIALTAVAGLVSIITLRRVLNGTKLGLTLLSLAAVVALQIAAGRLSAEGANLLWVHVPLGAALVGVAVLAISFARGLGGVAPSR